MAISRGGGYRFAPVRSFGVQDALKFQPFNIFGRLLASAAVLAGFYLLWLGFVESNLVKAVLGGILIPAGLYLMVSSRRKEIRRESESTDASDGPMDDAK